MSQFSSKFNRLYSVLAGVFRGKGYHGHLFVCLFAIFSVNLTFFTLISLDVRNYRKSQLFLVNRRTGMENGVHGRAPELFVLPTTLSLQAPSSPYAHVFRGDEGFPGWRNGGMSLICGRIFPQNLTLFYSSTTTSHNP